MRRLLAYRQAKGGGGSLVGVRDFPHGRWGEERPRRHWVLGAMVEGARLLTLSLLVAESTFVHLFTVQAWGSATERELRLWRINDGTCLHTLGDASTGTDTSAGAGA